MRFLVFPSSFPNERLLWKILDDEELKKLFPGVAEANAQYAMDASQTEWWTTTGLIGCMNALVLAEHVVMLAAVRLSMSAEQLCLSALLETIGRVLNEYRDLGRSKKMRLPAIVGLAGASLGDSQSIVLDDETTLRRARNCDGHVLGLLGNTAVVLQIALPVRLLAAVPFDERDMDDHEDSAKRPTLHALDELRDRIKRVCLSVLIASSGVGHVAVQTIHETFSSVSGPGMLFGVGLHAATIMVDKGQTTLGLTDPDTQACMQKWFAILSPDTMNVLSIAATRVLAAASADSGTEESIVDIAIAFESLFGTENNPAKNVRDAVARLLHGHRPESPEWHEVLRKLSLLFKARNSIVHAFNPPSFSSLELQKIRESGIKYLLQSIATIVKSHRYLLDLPSSEARVQELLRGGESGANSGLQTPMAATMNP